MNKLDYFFIYLSAFLCVLEDKVFNVLSMVREIIVKNNTFMQHYSSKSLPKKLLLMKK